MKKVLLVSCVVFALGYTIAIAAQSAGLISFTVFGLRVLIAGVIASGLVSLVFSDYSRRPRFRVRRTGQLVEPLDTVRDSIAHQPSCDWTYTTRSA